MVHLGLPLLGRKLVTKARKEAPVRKVRSSSGNVVTRYYSRKMMRVVATESHTAEQAGAYLYEFDPRVIEYYPQPTTLDLVDTDPGTGRVSRRQHIPDFLVLTEEGIYLDEWKQADRLKLLALRQPERFALEAGDWRSPLLEQHCKPFGVQYRLRSTENIPQQRLANSKFLADYLDPEFPGTSPAAAASLRSLFEKCAEIPLSTLVDEVKTGHAEFTTDDIYRSLAVGGLCIELDEANLSDTERVLIYRDQATIRLLGQTARLRSSNPIAQLAHSIVAGSKLGFDGKTFEVLAVGTSEFLLRDGQRTIPFSQKDLQVLFEEGRLLVPDHPENESGGCYELRTLSPAGMAEIEQRRAWLLQAEQPGNVVSRCDRTLRRYRRRLLSAGDNISQQNLALVSHTPLKGNRLRKVPEKVLELVHKVEQERHNQPRAPSKHASYFDFVQECFTAGVKACSERTFLRELKTSVQRREGHRRAYQETPGIWYLFAHEPINGVRPFEIVHIDCTPVELILRTPWGKQSLGTVWLCLAMDAESRLPLGFHLSFESPSYRTTMMVLRDMVRRFGRMPEILVVDQGPENRALQLQRVCLFCGTSLRQRPAGAARAGSVLERHFGVTHTQFIHLLDGNTKIRKHHRSVTKAVRPENFAAWTLPAFHGALEEYFYELYGLQTHPAHGEAPVTHFRRRLLETGCRCSRMVRFDRLFLIETCPAPKGAGTRQVDAKHGVKVDHIWYWSEAFRNSGMDNKTLAVRVDPWDPGVVFVLIQNVWVECVSKYRALLGYLTWVELRYVLNDLKAKLAARKVPLTEERIAAHLRLLDPKNFDPRLRDQQQEARLIYEGMGIAAVNGALDSGSNPFRQALPTLQLESSHEPSVVAPAEIVPILQIRDAVIEVDFLPSDSDHDDWDYDNEFKLI